MIYITIQSIVVAFLSLLAALFFFFVAVIAVKNMQNANKRTKLAVKLSELKDDAFAVLLGSKDADIKRFHEELLALKSKKLKVKSKR